MNKGFIRNPCLNLYFTRRSKNMDTIKNYIRETNLPSMNSQEFESSYSVSLEGGNSCRFSIPNKTDPTDQTNYAVDMFNGLWLACASALSRDQFKPKEGKAALRFKDPAGAGDCIFAFIAEYVKEGDEGSWMFSGVFNTIDELKTIDVKNQWDFNAMEKIEPFGSIFNSAIMDISSAALSDIQIINGICISILKSVRSWLETNAKEDAVVEVIFDSPLKYSPQITAEDYKNSSVEMATASVEIVKGEKIMTVMFGEELREIAKGNADAATMR